MRAVVFDFYYTLVNPELHRLSAIDDLIRRHGSEVSAEDVWTAWTSSVRPFSTTKPGLLDGPVPVFESLTERWLTYGANALASIGLPADGAGWAHARSEAHRLAETYADVAPALAALRAMDIELAVVSDTDDAYFFGCMAEQGLAFDVVVTSESMRCYKPHRSMFAEVCKRLGVEPAEALYVGDSPTEDVAGPQNAGRAAAWINRRGIAWPTELSPPDHTIESLTELPGLCL